MRSGRVTQWFLDIGTQGLPSKEQRMVRAANLCSLLGIIPALIFGMGYLFAGWDTYWLGSVINFAAALGYASAVAFAGLRLRNVAAPIFVTVGLSHVLLVSLLLGRDAGFQLYFLAIIPLPLLLVSAKLRFYRYFTLLAAPLLYALVMIYGKHGWVPASERALLVIHLFTALLCAITIGGLVAFFALEASEAEGKYEREYERSEALLLNVLPPAIAERLKSGEQQLADRFSDVSVLFADLVGFTALSARLPPEELVRMLNRVFTRFDELADRFKLEKIKTIGDAYMIVGGLPEPSADHVERIARMALAMMDAVADLGREQGTELAVRIGIHSGPVVAGVIGKKKFNYDLWGDTVNIASRMESHGMPGEIQVTEAVRAQLPGPEFVLVPRGKVELKGKGATETFLLERAASGPAS